MYRKTILGLCLGIATLTVTAFAQSPSSQPPDQVPDQTPKVMFVRGGVYVVTGGQSNTGFIIGDKGVILFDPQMWVPVARKELAEIAKITPKAVNEIIVSHSDPDHVGGLPAYTVGTDIIAQENCKAELQSYLTHPPVRPELYRALANYLPTRTVRKDEKLVLDGVPVELIHVAPAHTDGDLVAYLPRQGIVFTGDLLTMDDPNNPSAGLYPVIHTNKHGSSLGWIKFTKAILALDADTFIAGHGTVVESRARVQAAVKATEQRRAEIKTLFDQGKNLDEIKAALHEPPVAPGATGLRFPSFTETTYQELLWE